MVTDQLKVAFCRILAEAPYEAVTVSIGKDCQGQDIRVALADLQAALSTDAEPVKTPFEIASNHIPEARVSLLSRAIRQGLNDYGWKNFGTLPEVLMGYIVEAERAEAAVHAEPVKTAPAVAVKELRWKGPDSSGEYHSLEGLWGYIIRAESVGGFWLTEIGRYFSSPKAAQAAAQADYEARILSALSAQVQDVAETESETVERMVKSLRDPFPSELLMRSGGIDYWRDIMRNAYRAASPASKHGDAE